jgi:hypothetical protein
VRRSEWCGDLDDGDESGDRDVGDADVSGGAHGLRQLHGGCVEHDGAADYGDVGGDGVGGDVDGELGVDGIDGVYGSVLVRRELRHFHLFRGVVESVKCSFFWEEAARRFVGTDTP